MTDFNPKAVDEIMRLIHEAQKLASEAGLIVDVKIREAGEVDYDALLTEQGKNWRATVAPEDVK